MLGWIHAMVLACTRARRQQLAYEYDRRVPLVVKVAPDLEDQQIPEIAAVVARNEFDGLIATNTTISREAVKGMRHAHEQAERKGFEFTPEYHDITDEDQKQLWGYGPDAMVCECRLYDTKSTEDWGQSRELFDYRRCFEQKDYKE